MVKYLARYVLGSAIHDTRLVSAADGRVSFAVKNRRSGASEVRQVSITEFLSRYLLHVLPPGLARIRYYGWWSSNNAAKRAEAQRLCGASSTASPTPAAPPNPPPEPPEASSRRRCPQCQQETVLLLVAPIASMRVVRREPLVERPAQSIKRGINPAFDCRAGVHDPPATTPPVSTGLDSLSRITSAYQPAERQVP